MLQVFSLPFYFASDTITSRRTGADESPIRQKSHRTSFTLLGKPASVSLRFITRRQATRGIGPWDQIPIESFTSVRVPTSQDASILKVSLLPTRFCFRFDFPFTLLFFSLAFLSRWISNIPWRPFPPSPEEGIPGAGSSVAVPALRVVAIGLFLNC